MIDPLLYHIMVWYMHIYLTIVVFLRLVNLFESS